MTDASIEALLDRPRLLTELLDGAVARKPAWKAIDFFGRTWTWGELGRQVNRAARGLQDLGLKKGDRLALCLPNLPYYPVLFFAAHRIGVVIVNMNPLYVEREMKQILGDSGAVAVAVPDLRAIHDKLLAVLPETSVRHVIMCPMAGVLPFLQSVGFRLLKRKEQARVPDDGRHVDFSRLVARDAAPDTVAIDPHELAVLQYTGGTTGLPKGAMLSHANLTANSAQMLGHLGKAPEKQERTLGVLPLFHVFALTTVLNYSVETAAEMVLLPRFEMKGFLATLRRTKPTQFFGVPTIFGAVNALPDGEFPDLSSIRIAVSGGAPLPFDVRQLFEKRSGVRVVEGYGLSEASPIITCNPVEGEIKDNSCGIAVPHTVIEIRSLEDPSVVLGTGEKGEVCVRGPQVMLGYWNHPQATKDAFVDGALRTGDVGYLDSDGYLFLVDRIKDMILAGGYNVYPRVIEDALYEHPAVAEAIVIGVDDPYRGQSPKAFVALRPGVPATKEEILDFLRARISKIEMPREIEFRDSLPKTLIGKLSKKELIEEERQKRSGQAPAAGG